MEDNHYINDIESGGIAVSKYMKGIHASIVSTEVSFANHVSFANYLNGLNEDEYSKLIAFLDEKIKLK